MVCLCPPPLQLSRVAFWYHMWGATVGTLTLVALNGLSGARQGTWTHAGNQGNSWQEASVYDLTHARQVRFVGTTGDDFTSDMALDDVSVHVAPSAAPTATFRPTFEPTVSPYPTMELT